MKGQKGFTLIELLVVIAILGVLAAIVTPNVVQFMSKGAVEAANTESHNVQTAVVAYMADTGIEFTGDVSPTLATGPELYITNPEGLQATYSFDKGVITGAEPTEKSKWSGLEYTVGTGWHKK